ncbi:hypothetical protein FOMG_08324 [Fusarium oxysporum f. sp. melonis 26406]|uniref:Uncharacterized protein n=1 Tax=Fusarium oxysporum f. sp. melonis 26406 TaxID=1089452 RepID=X0AAS6_FUSOX|nr:hypothetical protein FOMG_08324 [Fusarium oxysporum f. sp. melonis 26406]
MHLEQHPPTTPNLRVSDIFHFLTFYHQSYRVVKSSFHHIVCEKY